MRRLGLALLLGLWALPWTAAAEGFESGLGTWSASGLWHRVVAPACVEPYEGTACVYMGRDSSCDYNDGRLKDDSLTSAPQLLSDPAKAFVSFWLQYEVESLSPSCYDRLRLERSEDGVNWSLLADLTPLSDPPGGGPGLGLASGSGLGGPPLWQFVRVDLSAFLGLTLRLRFRFVSGAAQAGNPFCPTPDAEMDDNLGVALDQISFNEDAPALSLGKSVQPGFCAPGGTATFSLRVRNDDAAPQTLSVWDTLPAGLLYVSASPLPSASSPRVDWSLPSVASGAEITLSLVVRADPAVPAPRDWINSADAVSTAPGPVVSSGQALLKLRDNGLRLIHSAAPSIITSGDAATYVVRVENFTALTQTGLSVSQSLPGGLIFDGAYPAFSGSLRWDLGPLAPGGIRLFTLWGRGFGEDGARLTANATLSQGGPVTASAATVTVKKPIEPAVWLKGVYPNPAPSDDPAYPPFAHIVYELNQTMPMKLNIFNIAGERVRSLEAPGETGKQQATWDLNNDAGYPVASGVYVFRLWSPLAVIPTVQVQGFIAVQR